MALLAVTRLRLRDPKFGDAFLGDAIASYEQAFAAPGHLATEVLSEPGGVFWTKSAWVDRASMRAFMTSGAHAATMPRLRDRCDEAHSGHWEQESVELPSWEDAHRRLVDSVRPSRVDHPAPAHADMAIPAPVVGNSTKPD